MASVRKLAPHVAFVCPLSISQPPLSLRPQSASATCPVQMSLTSELMFKAIEVGAATYATRAVAPRIAEPVPVPEPEPKRGLFGRAAKPPSAPPPKEPISPIEALISAIMAPSVAPGGDALGAEARADVREISGAVGGAIGSIAEAARRDVWTRLVVCVLIDLVGSGSLAVPFLGDALDVVTAPVSALLLHAIFADARVTAAGLAEELLPGTDIMPTATIAWVLQNAGYLRENGLKIDPAYVEAFAGMFDDGKRAKRASKGGVKRNVKVARKSRGKSTRKARGKANASRGGWW